MRTSLNFCLLAAAALSLATFSAAGAQAPDPLSRNLRVRLWYGVEQNPLHARVVSVQPDTLVAERFERGRAGDTMRVAFANVSRIEAFRGYTTESRMTVIKKNTLTGTAAGFVGGAAFALLLASGVCTDREVDCDGGFEFVIRSGVVFAGVGAATGALIGAFASPAQKENWEIVNPIARPR